MKPTEDVIAALAADLAVFCGATVDETMRALQSALGEPTVDPLDEILEAAGIPREFATRVLAQRGTHSVVTGHPPP